MAFATMNASPPRISLKSEKISIYLTEDYDILLNYGGIFAALYDIFKMYQEECKLLMINCGAVIWL